MNEQKKVWKNTEILDELIDNAAGLPAESQELLLMMARGMAYTRECMNRSDIRSEEESKAE